jgi:hypothetical protein
VPVKLFIRTINKIYILALFLLFREQTDQEVAFLIRIKSGWHNAVASRLELETVCDFPSIDESVRAGTGSMVQEIILVETSRLQIILFKLKMLTNFSVSFHK